MITIKELADLCGVSIATVSRAMNARAEVKPQTRERILAAAEKYGYVPNSAARNLKLPATRSVAVVVQGHTSELLIRLLGIIDAEFEKADYETLLFHVSDSRANAQTISKLVTSGSFSGLIFLGRYGDNDHDNALDLSRYLSLLDIPIAFSTTTDFSNTSSPSASVTVDDSAGARLATRHLLDYGHQRIAYALVDPSAPNTGGHAWMLRHRGYRSALEEENLDSDDTLAIVATEPSELYSMENAYRSTRDWLEQDPPRFSAVVASCDAVALGVIRALTDAGLRVPEDVSVTGFDGLEFSRFARPSITTLVQPLQEIGEKTVDVLLRRMAYPHEPPGIFTVDGTLVDGESTGPAPDFS